MLQSAPNDLPSRRDAHVQVSGDVHPHATRADAAHAHRGGSPGARRHGGEPRADPALARPDGVSAALSLASRGFAVFPLRPGTKVPAVRRDWEGQATADPARLRQIVRPGANVGVACGPSGLLVLDLDVAKEQPGTGPDPDEPRHGAEALRALAAGRELPPTLTVATPTGGRHLYYRAPRGMRLRNTVGRLGPLIDTRAEGGYVVGPGSIVDGRSYRVIADIPVASLPHWLLRELQALNAPPPVAASDAVLLPPTGSAAATSDGSSAYAAAALRNEVERVRAARVGTRNDTLNRAAFSLGRLVGAGILDHDLAVGELSDAARRAGLPPREVASTLSSGIGAGIARPRMPSRPQSRARPAPPRPASAQSTTQGTGATGADAIASPRAAQFLGALRTVDRAYDAAALRAAGLSANRDWRRLRALVDALRDVRDAVITPQATASSSGREPENAAARAESDAMSGEAAIRRAAALCHKISALASGLAAGFPASGRRSPLGRALRRLDQAARDAVRAAA
jgi:Bifunctional DNA primase/polymerase, N-terminal